jgi:uncharacterized integral membrane protein
MGFIKALIGIPLILVFLIFAFVNNDMANFSLWPTDIEITVSLSVAIVFLVMAGYVAGCFFSWLSYAPIRRSLRQQKKQNKKLSREQQKLSKEVEGLQGNLDTLKAAVPPEPKLSIKDKIKQILSKVKKSQTSEEDKTL